MIAAVVLAAGMSRRMGRAKQTLPWGEKTVITHIVQTLLDAQVPNIVVVTGAENVQVSALLADLPVTVVFNPNYQQHEMLVSLQSGLLSLSPQVEAALVCLGDQPQVKVEVVQAVTDAFTHTRAGLVVPSFNHRRGHPWLVARALWDDLLQLSPEHTLRDFLNAHQQHIHYLEMATDTILQDLDTPHDYQKYQP